MRPGRRGRYSVSRAALTAAAVVLALALGPPLVLFAAFLLFVRHLRGARPQPTAAPYRGGDVTVEPGEVEAGGPPVTVHITYTVGPEGIREGGGLRLCPGKVLRFSPERWRLCLQWGNGWGELQRRKPGAHNFLSVESDADVELDVSLMERAIARTQLRWLKRKLLQKMRLPLRPMDPRNSFIENQKVSVRLARGSLGPGDRVRFVLGSGAGLCVPHAPIETDFAIEIDPTGCGTFALEAAVPSVRAIGGVAVRFDVVAPTSLAPGDSAEVLVRCLDRRGALSHSLEGTASIEASGPLSVPTSIAIPPDAGGVFRFPVMATGDGVGRITVSSAGVTGRSNPVVAGASPYRVLWGDLHSHSTISDGTMEPGSLYRRAREEMGWDFTAVTDHDIWSLAEEGPRSAEELEMMVRSADEAYRPGELVTFPAYEWTDHRLGHRNVLFGPGEEPAFLSVADVRYSTPALLIEALVGRNVLVIGHHPAWKTHAGEMRFDYGPPGGPARLIEVYSDHGNSEFYGAPRPPTHTALARGLRGKAIRAFMGTEHAGPDSGSYVRDAWAAGQRLGLIAGSDEHLVGVDPADGIGIVYSGGITALLATGATREAVWDALVARRAYATTGARMYIEFSVDGRPMGSEIACQRAPLVSGRVIGTCELELVEVVKYDGGRYSTAWSGSGEDDISFEFEDASCRGDCFYYLRVIQRDGELAWAGPVWVDRNR